nr:Spo0E family sporulation regulatory protein-aspartic acid phosphatase [Tissierella simiarum]
MKGREIKGEWREKAVNKREVLEQERDKLYQLIEKGATKEAIQQQSEILDKCIVNYYLEEKGVKKIC